MTEFTASPLPGLLIALPLAGAALVPLFAFAGRRLLAGGLPALLCHAATAAVAVALFVVVGSGGPLRYALGGWPGPWGIELRLDGLSALFAVLVAAMGLAAAFVRPSVGAETPEPPLREGLRRGALLLLLAGLLGMVLTRDLFNLFVFMEVSSLAACTLIASGGGRAPVAAFRYLLAGTVAGSLYLFGVGFLYALTGTLNLDDLAARLPTVTGEAALAVAVVLIAVGLAVKAALFPLHGWLPDAYVFAPAPASGFIAGVMAKVSAYALLRLFGEAFRHTEVGAAALAAMLWLGILGTVGGGLLALAQREVSRILAWSSVSAMGAILLGIAIGSEMAIAGALFHAVAHGLAKGCLFLGAGGVRSSLFGGSRAPDSDDYRGGWPGLGERAPLTAAALTVAAFSLIGLPPTAGFFSKYLLLSASLQAGGAAGTAAFLALLVSSLLSAVYLLRVVEAMWFRSPAGSARTPAPAPRPLPGARPLAAAVFALAAGVLAVGVFAGPFERGVLPTWRPGTEPAATTVPTTTPATTPTTTPPTNPITAPETGPIPAATAAPAGREGVRR